MHGWNEKCIQKLSEYLRGRNHMVHLAVSGGIILNYILQEECVRMWIGFIWLWIECGSGTL